jgi:hypothetical protein
MGKDKDRGQQSLIEVFSVIFPNQIRLTVVNEMWMKDAEAKELKLCWINKLPRLEGLISLNIDKFCTG